MYPEEVKEVINYANKQRFTITEEKARDESIIITEDWKKEIAEYPFISKKKGRMSALLKQKSKIIRVKKPRKIFPAYDFKKRMRNAKEDANAQTQSQTQTPDEEMKDDSKKKIQPTVLETFGL